MYYRKINMMMMILHAHLSTKTASAKMSYICRKQVSCSFDHLTRTADNLAYNYCLLGFEFLLPVSMIVVCYAGMVFSIRRQGGERDLSNVQSSRSDQETVTNRMQREKRRQDWKLAKVCRTQLHQHLLLFYSRQFAR